MNGVRTGFVWDNGNIIETTDGNGNPTGIYKYGLGRVSDNKGNYYIYNAHGDVMGLTDSAGNVVREYEYDAFGMEVSKDKNDTNPFRYCGEYYDNETESIYLRARNYDPGMGRFTSEDPARDGLNWYVYCGNNPVAFADPFGMIPTKKEAAEMASHIYWGNDSDPIDDRSIKVNGKGTGWLLIQVKTGREGMKMGIYAKTDKTHSWKDPLEYALVFKGTDKDSFSDWKNNAEQYLSSRSADMWDALGAANSFVTDYPGREVTFVGHSKGGAEAIAAAVYKNKAAITFNPMVANLEDYVKDYKKRIRNYNASMMTNYVIKGDGLNGLFGENEVGKTVYEATQLWLVNEKINLNSLPYYDIMSQFTGKNYEYSIQIADPVGNHSIDLFR